MGHYRKKEVNEIVFDVSGSDENYPLYCIILLGYVREKTSMLDRISKKRMSKKNRTVDSFLHQNSLAEFPKPIRQSLEHASRAPSAMNSQKWYYLMGRVNDEYFIELGKPKGYQHFKWRNYDIDVGTAAAHIWLGLNYVSMRHDVSLRDEDGNAVWNFRCYDQTD
jgi:hypothetical protein